MASGLKLHLYEICKYYLISDKCEACVVIDETPDNYYDQLNSKMRRRSRREKKRLKKVVEIKSENIHYSNLICMNSL